MKIGRVVGTVVSTIKAPVFDGQRLLVCDLVDPSGEGEGDYAIAVPVVNAGQGDLVLILDEGTSARQIVGAEVAPIRAVIVGIIDEVKESV